MSRFILVRAAALLLLVAGAAGCRDEIPTSIGPDRFPPGGLLTSLVMEIEAAEFLENLGVFGEYTFPRNVAFDLVANDFDGGLQARTLFRLGEFPTVVNVPVVGDTVRAFPSGEVVARFDTAASQLTGPVTLRLVAAGQAWNSTSATWELASDTAGVQVPWGVPGGSPGIELARTTLTPGDTLQRDTIRWEVDSLALARMQGEEFHGVVVLAEGTASRLQLGPIELRALARTASRPDTLVTVTIGGAPSTFIFTPAPSPLPANEWVAGGVGAARSIFRVSLPERVRACPPNTPAGAPCPERPLREVILNEVVLVLRPVPVGGGFRPLAATEVALRTVAEPELGRQAPLGPSVLGRQVPGLAPLFASARVLPAQFDAGATADTSVFIVLTDHFRNALVADTAAARVSTAFALLQEPEGITFGQAHFRAAPRLRLVYTLPVQQVSP